jgi:hypothetical protein
MLRNFPAKYTKNKKNTIRKWLPHGAVIHLMGLQPVHVSSTGGACRDRQSMFLPKSREE